MKSYKEEIRKLAKEISEIEILASANNIDYMQLVDGEIEDEILTPMLGQYSKHAESVMNKYEKKEYEIGDDVYKEISKL